MSPSRFSIATTSRLVKALSFKETIRCLTYLDRTAMMHHTNLRTYVRTIRRRTRRSIPQIRKKPSTSSVEAFRFAEEAFRFVAKLRCKRKSGKMFRRAASFLKTCTVHADTCPVLVSILTVFNWLLEHTT